MPQQSKTQHGLRTVLAIFPVMRKQIPSATLVVVASDAVGLPADIRRDLQAPWVSFKGVATRQLLLEEALRSEVFIYLPTATETHHTLVVEMMMADQLILAQRFPSVQTILDKERGVFLEQVSITYGHSLHYVWSQPPLRMVTASITYGDRTPRAGWSSTCRCCAPS